MVDLKYFCVWIRKKTKSRSKSVPRHRHVPVSVSLPFIFLLVFNSCIVALSHNTKQNDAQENVNSEDIQMPKTLLGSTDASTAQKTASKDVVVELSANPHKNASSDPLSPKDPSRPLSVHNSNFDTNNLLTNRENASFGGSKKDPPGYTLVKPDSANDQNRLDNIIYNNYNYFDSLSFGSIFSNNSFESYLANDRNGSRLNYSYYFENNVTTNETLSGRGPLSEVILMGVTSVILGVMILITVIGNVFVIAAILLERNLQNVANYLIVSLAVADLMVACLVMPLGAVYEISQGWILGPELCDMWTSSDVLCCTASILHLVAIALDRYWAVTNVDYIHTRNGTRIVTMIVVVWSVAVVVSLAPQFGWKDPEYMDRINKQTCLVSQDIGYQIFATCSTFYVPLAVILVLYWKIFQTARKRIRRRREQRNALIESTRQSNPNSTSSDNNNTNNTSKFSFITKRRFITITRYGKSSKNSKRETVNPDVSSSLVLVEGQSTCSVNDGLKDSPEERVQSNCELDQISRCHTPTPEVTTVFTIRNHSLSKENDLHLQNQENSPDKPTDASTVTNNGSASHQSDTSKTSVVTVKDCSVETYVKPEQKSTVKTHSKKELKRESLEAKRERKAAKTLAIITGAFVVCWLPFFIMALLMPLCAACSISKPLASIFLWLGYFNSTLNPVIYTIFNPEFRQAFKRILCGDAGSRSRGRLR